MLSFGNKEFRNLQEQVLKNAQDIETLKGRENLKIVIVEELPEEGNPNYIYLVPNEDGDESNVYNEYIWLADEETYEQIGAVNIDLTNYVTTNTEQEITGAKSYTTDIILKTDSGDSPAVVFQRGTSNDSLNDWRIIDLSGYLRFSTRTTGAWQEVVQITSNAFQPVANNAKDLGVSGTAWKDFYLSGSIYHTSYYFSWDNGVIFKTSSNTTLFYIGNNGSIWFYGTLIPSGTSGTRDIGDITHFWRDIYVTGSLKDGASSVTVANISTKATSAQASGTFDSNGTSTFLVADGTLTGLFVFTYGNCQCMFQLTETMVQNADVTPIRIAIPMMYNSVAVNGWLEISVVMNLYSILITDGTNHVDSGYAWVLTKTNLL